ncbi:MAG TPA: hypothetical protein PKU94_03110 [Candidatus Hydrothermia bacterium]|nr:hypothetical protein [Candidatus Hydrothermae bacterium]HOP32349.1 hypothetical protein [Candidatus Hydrothermia bacterium]HRD23120.1 hypothetical protein [Candidatus Hydrothermia bacterium]
MVDIFCELEAEDLKFQSEYLEMLQNSKEHVIVNFDILQRENINIARVYVAALDWPGLGETVIGLFHGNGYNVGFIYGVVSLDERYAFLTVKVPFNPDKLEQVKIDLESIMDQIKSIAREGNQTKTKLVTTGIEKLEILENVRNALREISFPEEYEEISRAGGELEKFVFSRSLAYLKERDAKTLADIILTGHRFTKKLRQIGIGIEVNVKNIKTAREELTGVTVGGFEKDLSMDTVFDVIKEIFPNFRRKFDKEFITNDGITIIRIEFTVDERPLTPEEIKALEQHLKANLKQAKLRIPLNIKFGGEIFGRALVPKMLDETMETGITQVAIIPVDQDRTTITFRIAIVNKDPKKIDTLIGNITRSDGFVLTSFRPPVKIKDVFAEFLTVRALLSFFKNDIELYEKLKEVIRESIGDYRDFDEGLRTLDRKNLEKVYEITSKKGIAEEITRSFYFAIDDFIRTTITPEQIVNDLEFVDMCIKKHLEQPGNKYFTMETKTYYNIVIVYQPEERIFDRVLTIIEDLRPLLVRFEIYGLNVTLVQLNKKEIKNIDEIYKKIKTEVYHEDNPLSDKS